ncbi:hypothetical protein EMCG_01446 [[Emmonsia] crescens]|uniref:Uncharacterized protein n=1 Tax=[Emmonsia] crescens TaxID=73230 RepID=A0A0G2I0U4_9EURO|nr:hypothetical protein EMCG_01446 [Emmonsia crescens UAMH 3008]
MPPLAKPVAGPRVLQVKVLTAEDVTLQPLIKYCDKAKRHVKSSSFHGLWYVGELEIWAGFENEVGKNFAGIEWKDHPTILAYGLPSEEVSELHLYAGDHFICGEELSISGRWRKRKNLIPDYALIVEENGAPRAVGEAKTPWYHDFQALWVDIQNTKKKLVMRRALGQIGNYMIELQLKYGFLTNFDQTFFLKREIVNNEETLYCSPPVKYNASPLYGDKIFLRQSLLLLQSSVVGNESVWKTEKTSEAGIIRKKKSEKMEDAKRRVGDAVQGLDSGMDDMSHEFEGLSVEEGERRARFDPNPISDPLSRSSTLRPKRR